MSRAAATLRGGPTPSASSSPPPPTPVPPAFVVAERPGRLVIVTGPLDGPGIAQLDAQLSVVLTEGTAILGLDLSRVTECRTELFAVLARVHARLRERAGWMRLLGLSPAVLAAMENAPIQQILTVYLTSDWTPGGGGGADDAVAAEPAPAGVEVPECVVPPPRHAPAPR